MLSQSIPVGVESLPIFPTGTIKDRFDEDDSVCFVCELNGGDDSEIFSSYCDWAKRHEWTVVDHSAAVPEWSLMMTKGAYLLNLSLRHTPEPLLLVTILDRADA